MSRGAPAGLLALLLAAALLSGSAATSHAAVSVTGDVSPSYNGTDDPWDTGDLLGVGTNAAGEIVVGGGSRVLAGETYLGEGGQGVVIVRGPGSEWANSGSALIGNQSPGEFHVEEDATATFGDYVSVGSGQGTTGLFSITGAMATANYIEIGGGGDGELRLTDGGVLNVLATMHVSAGGAGRITFDDGVLNTTNLFASPADLSGSGVINTVGLVSDLDLVLDATHGPSQAIAVPTGAGQQVTLNLALDAERNSGVDVYLGAGYRAAGSLTIADGVETPSTYGYLGYSSGAVGMALVTGEGSHWDARRGLVVGSRGQGVLRIEEGGTVTSSYSSVGAIDGIGEVTVTGAASTWTAYTGINLGSNGSLTVADEGLVTVNGTLYVSGDSSATNGVHFDGGVLTASGGLSARPSAFTGDGVIRANGIVSDIDLTVDSAHGLVQEMTINDNVALEIDLTGATRASLGAGYAGAGTLQVSDGIVVETESARLGVLAGSNGVGTVSGQGSGWEVSSSTIVGESGSGRLEIERGAHFTTDRLYLAFQPGSTGDVDVSGEGSRLDVESFFTVGGSGDGSLRVSQGGSVVGDGWLTLADRAGVHAFAEVVREGSRLEARPTWIGKSGTAELVVAAGADAAFYSLALGEGGGASGQVFVVGEGSTIQTESDLELGYFGAGELTVAAGGLVTVGRRLEIDRLDRGASALNLMTGGTLALNGDGSASIDAFLDLTVGAEAVNYWDGSGWAPITAATPGVDYQLALVAEGDLAGYTLLTVGELPLAGDYDGDGVVTPADYDVWASQFGRVGAWSADGNADGRVDAADYSVWRDNHSSGASTGESVPEPATIGALLFAVGIARGCSRPSAPRS